MIPQYFYGNGILAEVIGKNYDGSWYEFTVLNGQWGGWIYEDKTIYRVLTAPDDYHEVEIDIIWEGEELPIPYRFELRNYNQIIEAIEDEMNFDPYEM